MAPTPVARDVVLARFISGFLDAQPDFRITCTVEADLHVGQDLDYMSAYLAGDISGEDFSGFMSMQTAGLTVEADMVVVDGSIYVRPALGDWMPGEEFEQTQPLNPLPSDIASSLEYRGTVVRNAETVHDIYVNDWVGGDVKSLRRFGFRHPAIASSALDVYVRDDGMPMMAYLTFTVTARYARQPVEFDYLVTYSFTNIGQSVPIEAPI